MPGKGEFVTHCKRGHERTPENLKNRGCKICALIRENERKNTEEGRIKYQERQKKHIESGKKAARAKERWVETRDNPGEKEKRAELRKQNIEHRRQYLHQWRKDHPQQTRETSKRNSKRAVEEIRAHYAQATLGLRRKDVVLPDEIIEVQRLRIQLKREMRKCKESKPSMTSA
jgi:hypothetical protein